MPRTVTSAIASKAAGQAIRQARRQLGITQAELAERLGVTASYIANLEAGRTNATIGQLAAVADAMTVEMRLTFEVLSAPEPRLPPPRLTR